MPQTVTKLLSFEWITQFFSLTNILNLVGIQFNPTLPAEWCLAANAKKPGSSDYNLADDYPLADLNLFFSFGFMNMLPTYTAAQYRDFCLNPFELSLPILCFFEKLINAFIMLVWSLLGISAVIPPPLISLCNSVNNLVNPQQLATILNNNLASGIFSSQSSKSSPVTVSSSDEYIYEIKLPNGKIISDLNQSQLDQFMENNNNYNYDFLNF